MVKTNAEPKGSDLEALAMRQSEATRLITEGDTKEIAEGAAILMKEVIPRLDELRGSTKDGLLRVTAQEQFDRAVALIPAPMREASWMKRAA
jgi:hypothetical protein